MDTKLNHNLIFLFMVIVFFVSALFAGDFFFKDDAQFFQVLAAILASIVTVFVQAAKSVFHIPDNGNTPPNSTKISSETLITKTPPEPKAGE